MASDKPRESKGEERCAKCGMVALHYNHTYWERTHTFAPAPAPTPAGCGADCHECDEVPALRAALDTATRALNEAETFLRRILAADMTGNEAERNRASGEAALYLAKRAREARNG